MGLSVVEQRFQHGKDALDARARRLKKSHVECQRSPIRQCISVLSPKKKNLGSMILGFIDIDEGSGCAIGSELGQQASNSCIFVRRRSSVKDTDLEAAQKARNKRYIDMIDPIGIAETT